MHAKEHLQWLEEQGLLEKAKTYSEVFKKVFRDCLDVQKDERILIITDQGKEDKRLAPIVSGAYYLAAREMGFDVTMIVQAVKIKGDKADENTLVALQELGNGKIVVMCLSGKLGSIRELSKSFRNFIRENHHRFVSATSLGRLTEKDYQVFIDSIDIDYQELQEKGREIKEKLDKAEEVRVVTDSGTDLAVGLKNKAVLNTGDYKNPGKGGNIPVSY
ncbi:hypothetical protein GOV06_05850, partial [Candidatus Woesearchaeota archaeon]|nr:hypothetical protein [Candidatus Woesearchaeota archaeon]